MPILPKKFRVSINLLHPQGLPERLPVRFLKWLLNYGRVIVIFVEILVLATFIARFKLDSDLADLKDQINSLVPFIESLSPTEDLIKETQFKIETFTTVSALSPNFPQILSLISTQTPQGVKFNNLNISKPSATELLQLRVSGDAASNNDVLAFLINLRSEPSFSNISLASISLEKGLISFTITGNIR